MERGDVGLERRIAIVKGAGETLGLGDLLLPKYHGSPSLLLYLEYSILFLPPPSLFYIFFFFSGHAVLLACKILVLQTMDGTLGSPAVEA